MNNDKVIDRPKEPISLYFNAFLFDEHIRDVLILKHLKR